MNLHFSFKSAKSPELENELQQNVQKLEKRLQVYRPDLIHLHGTIDSAPRDTFEVRLNLRLPSGQLSAQDSGPTAQAAMKATFSDIQSQLQRHKELLRSGHKWTREKFDHTLESAISSEEPADPPVLPPSKGNGHANLEAISAATFTAENRSSINSEVRTYLNGNLLRLERYVVRELRYLEANAQIQPSQISKDEVIDEVVVTALSAEEKPTHLAMERWLYRLARQAISRLSAGMTPDGESVPLEQSVGVQNVSGSDEAFLQFHQPGEMLMREDVIADTRAGNPEELAASDELIDQLESALHGVSREQREAFVLFAIEGFTATEISQVTDKESDHVRRLITEARDHLAKKLPSSHMLKKKLLQHSIVA